MIESLTSPTETSALYIKINILIVIKWSILGFEIFSSGIVQDVFSKLKTSSDINFLSC